MALYNAFEGLPDKMGTEAAVDHVQDCLSPCVLSRFDGEIISVNAAWTALCGYQQHEVKGQRLSLLQGPDTDRQRAKTFVYALHVANEATMTLVNYRKDAQPFVHVISSRKLASDDGDGFYLTQSREEYPCEQAERLRLEQHALRDEASTGKRQFSAAELSLMAVCMMLTLFQLVPGLSTRLVRSWLFLLGSGGSGGAGAVAGAEEADAMSVNLLDERDFNAALRFVRGVSSSWSST